MIQTVNHREFEAFGAVFAEKGQPYALLNGHSVMLTSSETALYETAAETWLGRESGMPVLSAVTKDGTTLDFLLDRTVRLKPGVQFSLTALGGNAAVQMAGYSMPRLVQTTGTGRFEMQPKLKISRLCALLCHDQAPDTRLPSQSPPLLELTYVDSGSLLTEVDGQAMVLEQGDMILYSKKHSHRPHSQPDGNLRLVTVYFEADGLPLEILCNRRFHSPKKAVALLQEMLREQERMDAVSQDMLIALLQALLLTLLRDENNREAPSPSSQYLNSENQIIRQAQQYIATHITEKLTVPAVAHRIQVSASYLTALFHRHLHISPGDYIRRVKLEKSRQLIREGNMNFTEISQTLAYSSVYHFSRQFKQTFGMTPSDYAKSVK